MRRYFLVGAVLSLVLVACPQPLQPTGTVIGSSGGTASSGTGVASATFPAGALTTDTTVTVTENTSPPAVPSTQKMIAGKTFDVGGGSGNFASAASLKIKLDPSEIAALGLKTLRPQALITQVVALQLKGATWTTVRYTFDTNTNTVTISIPGYGTYTLVVPNATQPPTATLSSIALTCTPTSIAVAATSTCAAVGKTSSGAALSPQPLFSFASSDTANATVSSAGVATGVAAGSSNLTASSGGVSSNAVPITVTAAPSGSGVTFVSTDPQARGKAISASGRVFYTTTTTQYVYDGTTSKALPALPSGYTGISFDLYALACIDSNGNVAFVAYKTGRINHAVYYDATADSIGVIPFGDENFVFGCNDAKQVVASDFNSGQKTHFNWQANDASATQLSRQSPDNIGGYRPLGFNTAGTILFPDGILKGANFTSIPKTSTFGSGLTNAGTVYGVDN